MVGIAVLRLEPESEIVAVRERKERRATPPPASRESRRLPDGTPPERRTCDNSEYGSKCQHEHRRRALVPEAHAVGVTVAPPSYNSGM